MTTLRGSISARPGGKYTVTTEPRWDPDKGAKVRKSLGTFATRQAAEKRRMEYTLSLLEPSITRPEQDMLNTTVGDFMSDWEDHLRKEHAAGNIERNTMIDYVRVARRHIAPHLGHLRIGDLTPVVLRAWVLDLADRGRGDRTIQKATRTLHRAFGDTDLRTNPAKLPRRLRPKVRPRRKEHPTSCEISTFLRHVTECDAKYGSRFAALWRLAATTGMRRGELAGLAWPDVDLDAHVVTVERTLQQDGSSLYVKGPKSKNGYRTIGVDRATMGLLRNHRSEQAASRLRAGAAYISDPLGHDWVFRGDDAGNALPPQRISSAFKREWEHADLRDGPSLHGLRHSHGSELILAGIPITQVAAHIGDHPHTLMLTYAHELDGDARRSAISEAVEAIY